MTDLFLDAGASFSKDRTKRYALWRIWDDTKPKVMFIGLNPSKANETQDDPTIRRVIRFAHDWGFGAVYMCNLFSQVTPYPEELKLSTFTFDDVYILIQTSMLCDEVVFCWGAFKGSEIRAQQAIKMFPNAVALEINKNGSPKHPLYVRADIDRVPYPRKDVCHE